MEHPSVKINNQTASHISDVWQLAGIWLDRRTSNRSVKPHPHTFDNIVLTSLQAFRNRLLSGNDSLATDRHPLIPTITNSRGRKHRGHAPASDSSRVSLVTLPQLQEIASSPREEFRVLRGCGHTHHHHQLPPVQATLLLLPRSRHAALSLTRTGGSSSRINGPGMHSLSESYPFDERARSASEKEYQLNVINWQR